MPGRSICSASYWGFYFHEPASGASLGHDHGNDPKSILHSEPFQDPDMDLRILAAGLCVYGVFAFVKHDIASYLFLRTHFVFFDMEQPLLSFFAEYLGMMGLWAILSYYAGKLLRRVGARSSR